MYHTKQAGNAVVRGAERIIASSDAEFNLLLRSAAATAQNPVRTAARSDLL